MTLRDLEIFIEVARYSSMSRAARSLFITQSSVSQVIADLERTYDVRLFDRMNRSLFLTPTGEELFQRAETLLSQYRATEQFLKEASYHKVLRLGATLTIGSSIMSSLLKEFEKHYPDICTEITVANTKELEGKLLSSELDAALVEGRILHPDLMAEPVISDTLLLVCGQHHPLYGKEGTTLHEIAQFPLIMREKGSGTRKQLEQALQKRNINYHIHWDSCSIEAIKQAVGDGHGVTVIGRPLVERECREGSLWACPIIDFNGSRTFDLVYHKRKYLSPELIHYMELVRSYQKKEQS